MSSDIVVIRLADRLFWTATRSGWPGILILLVLAGVFLSAIWQVYRRQTERVFQCVVIYLYLVAAFNLNNEFFTIQNSTLFMADWHSAAGCEQLNLLWWTTAEHIQFSLISISFMVPLVVAAIFTRLKDQPLGNPGCFPGAITALLGTLVLQLFFMLVYFAIRYHWSR